MKPVPINLPMGAKISNYLYPTMDMDDRTEDLVTVSLSNGFFIDAGWYPEHDPNGQFVVRVYYQFWDDQREVPKYARTIEEVVDIIEKLSERFSQHEAVST